MRTSELWLILLALAVLGLTAGTLAYLEASEGNDRIAFTESMVPLGESSSDVGAAAAELNWTLPANATGAQIGVLVTFTGQAFTGGTATVQAQLRGPDGAEGPIERFAFPIGQGATSGQANFTLELRWLGVPHNTTGDLDGFDRSREWSEPLTLVILVQEPGDLPTASYSFTARASGTATTYHHGTA